MDIVCEATSTRSPVFDGELLRPGQHIVSITGGDERFVRRSIDAKAAERCSHIAVHSLDVRYGLEEIVDCIEAGSKKWDEIVDLPDLVSGKRRLSIRDGESTFFKNNVGLGSQFAAVGGLVVGKAKEAGLGFVVPQEKVSQLMYR